jgi:CheY-like chemotaxis protein
MGVQLKALVVEDDAGSLELICETLIASGIETIGTRSPVHATDLVDREKFDGIFLDLGMPGLNGVELARRIRKSDLNATTTIIVVSGESPARVKEAFAAGAQFYLSKPLDQMKLKRLVSSTQGSLLLERLRNRPVDLRTALVCRTSSGEFAGVTSQISEKGMVFSFEGSLRPGEFVHFTFRLPKSRADVDATGTILRVMRDDGPQRAGCRFESLNPAGKKALREFLASAGAT